MRGKAAVLPNMFAHFLLRKKKNEARGTTALKKQDRLKQLLLNGSAAGLVDSKALYIKLNLFS